MVITMEHIKSVPVPNGRDGYCNRGIRKFCKRHSIDWHQLRKNGIDSSVLLDTGDAMALRVVKHAEGTL